LNPETGEINYEQVEALALEHKPKLIIAGFSAYSRVWIGNDSATLPIKWALILWSIWRTSPV